ncbi:nuclease-related domain-containing protein [Lysinibacillus sp. FSL K6-3209]|uniref:nuclease-related domain-containing protein n=1 Tax=Lysinibacillus sp. FSL K6-3209 TaxID=2921497 RepID=UPI0030D9619A
MLEPSHPQYITFQQELKNKEASDFAEQYILKELQKLPQLSDCHLFHDVILPTILPMQMDILIITASGIVLLEIKNIRGTASIKDYYMLVGDTITNR